jgi:uncharacterized delta-60 repeat protein
MPIIRPYAYNPTQQTVGVEYSLGNLAVGYLNESYSNDPGGLSWSAGPDETNGCVIAKLTNGDDCVNCINGTVIGKPVSYWGADGNTDQDFLNAVKCATNIEFGTKSEACEWMNNNGYWSLCCNNLNCGSFCGFNSDVYTTSIQSDGKIIIGGFFTFYSGIASNRIARLNTDGSYDPTFSIGDGFNNLPYTSSIQPDGKIILGGYFTSYSGISSNRIARLNTDGTYDSTFTIGTGFDSNVFTTSIQSDGKIIVGGVFTSYSGISSNRIARLNSDGTYDSTFSIGDGFNSFIYTSSIQSDGKIIVGGSFTSYSGISSNRIIRLNTDGSYDSTFSIGDGFNSLPYTSSIQPDGKIILGGFFTFYSGISSNRIARLNTDGSYDSTFSVGNGFNSSVLSLSIQSDGKIIAGGDFSSYSGISSNRIARLNSDGTYDSTFDIGTGFSDSVRTLSIQSDGKIIVGGGFNGYNDSINLYLTRLNSDGSNDKCEPIGLDCSDLTCTWRIVEVGQSGQYGEYVSIFGSGVFSGNTLVGLPSTQSVPFYNYSGYMETQIISCSSGNLYVLDQWRTISGNPVRNYPCNTIENLPLPNVRPPDLTEIWGISCIPYNT